MRSVGRRLLDAIDPDLLATAEHALTHVEGVQQVRDLRLRWVGHRLQGDATIVVAEPDLRVATAIALEAEHEVRNHLHTVDDMRIRVIPAPETVPAGP